MSERQRIVAAAIRYGSVVASLPKPARHHDIIWAWKSQTGKNTPGSAEQGFLTSDGRFVNRVDAAAIAELAGQLPSGLKEPLKLYSEDLW